MADKGHCKHGEFILTEGCALCMVERYKSTGDVPPSVGSTTALPILTGLDPNAWRGGEEEIRTDETETTYTVAVRVKPETDVMVQSWYNEALGLQKYAAARIIKTVEDLKPATDDLSIIAKLKKAMEEKRKEYIKPLQDHVKSVNDAFKTLMAPIEAADSVTREKILAFQLKQKLIREEQERINALRMEAAKKEMELKGELTESVNLIEVIPEVAKKTITDMGSTGMKDHWTFEVVDFALLPDEYKMPDAVKIGKVVRAGLHTIPGVKIENKPILAVNTR